MKILIDIGHPAHVHYFKNFTKIVMNNGHEVLFTCRDKEITISLLEHYNFSYVNFGRPYKSLTGKAFGLFYFTFRILLVSIRFRPNLFLNATIYSAIVAWLMRKLHISIEDTFNKEQVKLYLPFTSYVLTGDYEHPPLGNKEIRYSGYQELFYLHPNRFIPDPAVLQELDLLVNEPFVIVRFVSWDASHDIGHNGISPENKIAAIKAFLKHAKVFISSEKTVPVELVQYCFPLPSHRMHHAMAFAYLIYGESATMVSEGAMLGVPGIYLDNTGRYYTEEQGSKYGLVFNYTESEVDQKSSIQKGVSLLTKPGIRETWQLKRKKMLAEKIDVTAFLVWFVENYPESAKIMKENPDFQKRFI